jgi:hypothetical protein
MEPDEGNRDTPFHMRILLTQPIAGTRCGHRYLLECGHQGMVFGPLDLAGGVLFCCACRDAWAAKMN